MAAHGGEKCFLNEILGHIRFANAGQRVAIEHVTMFIHPRSGIVASQGGCCALDNFFRHAAASTSGSKWHIVGSMTLHKSVANRLYEFKRCRIHAVAQSDRLGTIVEHVPKMRTAPGACDLSAAAET